ncbi:MAG: hypothetical protein D6677_13735 [Calditrichaeota bacterium]|nr:MAG: hypothetical protein D6677_13735 [Calditrichota bacterium]
MKKNTMGNAVGTLLVAATLSGLGMIMHYDVTHPGLSVSRMVIEGRLPLWLRNIHFWNAVALIGFGGLFLLRRRRFSSVFYAGIGVFLLYSGGWLADEPLFEYRLMDDTAALYLQHAVWGTLLTLITMYHFRARIKRPGRMALLTLFGLLIVSAWLTPQPTTVFDTQSLTRRLTAGWVGTDTHADGASWHALRGKYEACLSCHDDMRGLAPVHDPSALGCYACHRGNPFTLDSTRAHEGMVRIPGNLSTAALSCGASGCHPGMAERVEKSIMNRMTGLIAVNRYVFEEAPTPDSPVSVHDLGDSPADTHLRQLCVSCHLGKEKRESGPVTELSRGGGCNACHLNHGESSDSFIHPQLNLKVRDAHCFGCHSRSGRISLNYAGWHEVLDDSLELHPADRTRLLQDGRLTRFIQPDVHHEKGMACIDCHISYELMGDGNAHAHKEQTTAVRCSDCHTRQPRTKSYARMDEEERRIFNSRGFAVHGLTVLSTKKDNRALLNTFAKDSVMFLVGKHDGQKHPLQAPSEWCEPGTAHQTVSCVACHSAWVPQCIGCHTAYKPGETGRDHLTGQAMAGHWVEYTGTALAEAPVLGVRVEENAAHVIPVTPGMILTIDKADGSAPIYKRLFAPAEPHTIAPRGRPCISCHWDANSLGYGRGTLKTDKAGFVHFNPAYAERKEDGLPEDAWIAFMENIGFARATRTNLRPFTRAEQQRILRVGVCLTCHEGDTSFEKRLLRDFPGMLAGRTERCRVIHFKDVK